MEIVIDIGGNLTGIVIGIFVFMLFIALLKAGDDKKK